MRHGEVHNPKRVLYGRQPRFGLSEKGRREAMLAASKLKKKDIDRIFTSPLLRTRQTGAIIAGTVGVKPRISGLLVEVDTIFENIPLTYYHEKIQTVLYAEENIKKGQESISVIAARMQRFVKRIAKKYPGEKILVVSHGDPIMIFNAYSRNKEFTWNFKRKHYLKTGCFLTVKIRDNLYKWEDEESE
ncbi:MAG: phosphoglycerate mutase [Candidatus Gottesmanbacteria bacterium GW2011_GWA2_43_14]|uniref:Phosphoglycerate mutase n=1 Tax=Candidatus Gottesmanbacteria bacterium GW2011_GWA2_43_14 TaxID=1618443 RepID=A0A0G1DLI4_9BACT|nr:MAG: phosphoglycerate mutase [Candidatus Gottesmanbacteria bacterium GW2011_GWA2_43_14]